MASSSALDFHSIVIELESYYVSLKHEASSSQRSSLVCINTDLDNKLQEIQDRDPRHSSLNNNLIVRHDNDDGMTRVTDNAYEDYSRCGLVVPTDSDDLSSADGYGDTMDSNWSGFVPKPFVKMKRSEPVEDPEYDLANYYESITEQCIANLSHEMHKSPMKVQKRGHVLVVTCPNSPPPLPPKMMKPPPLPPKQKDRRFSDTSCIVNQCSVHKKTKMTLHHSRTSLEETSTTTMGSPQLTSKFQRSSASLTTTTTTTKQESCEELYLTAQDTLEGSRNCRMDNPVLVSKTKRIRASSFQSVRHHQQQQKQQNIENVSASETLISDDRIDSPLLLPKKRVRGNSFQHQSTQYQSSLQQHNTQHQQQHEHTSCGQEEELYLTAKDCVATTTAVTFEQSSCHSSSGSSAKETVVSRANNNKTESHNQTLLCADTSTTTFKDIADDGRESLHSLSAKQTLVSVQNNTDDCAEKLITSHEKKTLDVDGKGTTKSAVNRNDNTKSLVEKEPLPVTTSYAEIQALEDSKTFNSNSSTTLDDIDKGEGTNNTKTISRKKKTSREDEKARYTKADIVQGLLKDLNSVQLLITTDGARDVKKDGNKGKQRRDFAVSNRTLQRAANNMKKDTRSIKKENKEKAGRERSLQRLVTSFCDVRDDTKIWSVDQLMNGATSTVTTPSSLSAVSVRSHQQTQHIQYDTENTASTTTIPHQTSNLTGVRSHQQTQQIQYDTDNTGGSTTTTSHQQASNTMKKHQTLGELSKKTGGPSSSTTSVQIQVYRRRTEIQHQKKKANKTDKKKRRSQLKSTGDEIGSEVEKQRKLVNRRSSNLTPLTRLRLYEVKRRQQRLSLVMRSSEDAKDGDQDKWMDSNFLRCYKDAENNWKNTPLFHPFWYECMYLAQRRREERHKRGFHGFELEEYSPRRSLNFHPIRTKTTSAGTIRSLSYYNETDDIISIYKYFW